MNELILTPHPGGSHAHRVRITYPSQQVRDAAVATGMVDGMEASYARLEGLLGLSASGPGRGSTGG